MPITKDPFSSMIVRFMPPFGTPFKVTPVHRVIAEKDGYELCYLPGKDLLQDPEYWLLSEGGTKAAFGITGMLKSIESLSNSGLEIVIHRNNAYGHFWDKDHKAIREPELSLHVNSIYSIISTMSFSEERDQRLFDWGQGKLLQRFDDFRSLYGTNDIIPEYTDSMNLVTISTDCFGKCIYCPESSPEGMIPRTRFEIEEQMALARALEEKYHGDFLYRMNEGHLNTADLLQFHLNGWDDPAELAAIFYANFPEVSKLYAFMGVPSLKQTSNEYLTRLYNGGQGINRVLVGIEAADEPTSRFLGKNETYETKLAQLRRLQSIGYKVKPIVQVGAVGEGFYSNGGKFISGRESLSVTAKFISEFLKGSNKRKPDKVLISKYTPIEGTILKELHDAGKVVIPYSSHDGAEEDIRYLTNLVKHSGIDTENCLEFDYESALEGRKRMFA